VSNDNTDPMIRARFQAIELLLAQLIADRLAFQADAPNSAARLLTWLMANADRMNRLDVQPGEETSIRQETGYNLFETLNAALNFASGRQGGERPPSVRPAASTPLTSPRRFP
jgi:hypothetical protein